MAKALIETRFIPLIEVGTGGPAALAEATPHRLRDIIAYGRRHYTEPILRIGDVAARRWLSARGNPYLSEIEAIAGKVGGPGAFALNLSYEWSCTTAVTADPAGLGSRMRRTLDWPLDGLGRDVVVARFQGAAGEYYNVTWPGFVGVATAMAPGRFSAALNQPPLAKNTGIRPIDWLIGRRRYWKAPGLPPAHLLRRVFDECLTYDEAKRRLCEEPIAIPAFFTLSGAEPDEGCVIERLEDRYALRPAPACIANHWTCFPLRGWERGIASRNRYATMEKIMAAEDNDFDWVADPILNETTRLAVIANAAESRLILRGYEKDGPATEVFRLGGNQPAANPPL
jgi:hypothetical protein